MNSATHIRRWNSAASVTNVFSTASNMQHQEQPLIVIDWISLYFAGNGSTGMLFTLTDVGESAPIAKVPGILWSVAMPTTAAVSDGAHLTFPGGLPLKKFTSGGTEILDDTSSRTGVAVPAGSITITASGDVDSCQAIIGYHYERETERR